MSAKRKVIEYDIIRHGAPVRVEGYPVKDCPHLAIRRQEKEFSGDLNVWYLDHLPTGHNLSYYRYQKTAKMVADTIAELGNGWLASGHYTNVDCLDYLPEGFRQWHTYLKMCDLAGNRKPETYDEYLETGGLPW